ncbi:Orexin receptor type 2 [Holothuria leucospilota]|uniref:Orexin receptor type 2 n=1 Tax=Holothuria leucospilota TaxID=206669 RepID=A0A9Q1HA31_HOLLE|nr:Orexin receptor type 2 [Holothuria leucospilota]
MVVQRILDFELDRVLRDNFSDESGNSSYPHYNDSYDDNQDYCSLGWDREWMVIVSFVAVVLGSFTSILYLIVTIRHFSILASNFLFLNSFLLAGFVNLLSNGIFDIIIISSRCWHGGRLLCKALPTILDGSENAMILFIVAIILEHNHPYVHSFLSKNTKFRKRLTVTVLWLVTLVLSIPQVIIWDILEFVESGFFCTVQQYQHYQIHLHKGLFLEYIVPLLLLIAALVHAAAVWRKRSSMPTANQALEENYSRNDDNELCEETNNQCPPIRVTSVLLGVVLFVTQTPFYVAVISYNFFGVLPIILFDLAFLLFPIPSIVAPIVVVVSSPIHKKRLKETYQCIASCIAGRRVKEGFLLSAGDEEKL